MKKTLATIAMLALALSANAANYTFNAGAGASTNAVVDSLGRIFTSSATVGTVVNVAANPPSIPTAYSWTSAGAGRVAAGYFTTDALSGLSKTNLLGAFVQWTTNEGAFGTAPGGGRGMFSAAFGNVAAQPDSTLAGGFEGTQMYLLFGNGLAADFSDSTEFLVLKGTTPTLRFLGADPSATATAKTFTPANSVVLFGETDLIANVQTTNSDATVHQAWQMAAPVPEPSSAALGLFAGLGLLARRRRA